MFTGFQHLHSFNRYILLVLMVLVLVKSILGLVQNKSYSASDLKLNLFAMISAHVQLLVGLFLYFTSEKVAFEGVMKNKVLRFFTVEHLVGMLLAIALITLARIKVKKAPNDKKHKTRLIFYGLALILILGSIPHFRGM